MPAVTRLGDLCTGHADWPPRPSIEASSTVKVNGIGVVRVGDAYAIHCNSEPECHGGVLAAGSATVYVEGRQLGRIGDPVSCGSSVAQGSHNVFCGG